MPPPKFSALNSKFASVFQAPSHVETDDTVGVDLEDDDIPASTSLHDAALDLSITSDTSLRAIDVPLEPRNSDSGALVHLSRPSQSAVLSSSSRNTSIFLSSGSSFSVGRGRVLSGKDSEFFVDPIDDCSDPLSLEGLGLPPSCLQNYGSIGIQRLRPWQRECLNTTGVMEGRNLVYCTPTSSGKSLVAEVVSILRVKKLSKIGLFVVPFVSLAEEKYSHFHKVRRIIN
jgi:hypothetical protein